MSDIRYILFVMDLNGGEYDDWNRDGVIYNIVKTPEELHDLALEFLDDGFLLSTKKIVGDASDRQFIDRVVNGFLDGRER